jgi:hypothetical protein
MSLALLKVEMNNNCLTILSIFDLFWDDLILRYCVH